jgi:hypothetical protein
MKNIGPLIIVALMLIAGFTAFLLWGPFGEKPGLRQGPEDQVQPVTETPAPAKEPGAVRAAGGPAAGSRATVASSEASPSGPSAQPVATAPAPVSPPKPPRRFPQAADVQMGTDKAAIQGVFGPPTMRTVAVDEGRLLETWVYMQTDLNLATFVMLRNGRVISSTTTVY